jgi:hypothetical protein
MRSVMEDAPLRAKLAQNGPPRARMHPWDAIYWATEAEIKKVASDEWRVAMKTI